MDDLTKTQRDAVEQLQTLTNGSDADVAIEILKSAGWDVQVAAEMIFDGPSAGQSSAPGPSRPPIEQFELDDSEQGQILPRGTPTFVTPRQSTIWTILSFPFNLLSNMLRFIFGILRIPFPRLNFTGSLSTYRPPSGPSFGQVDPRTAADRWVRALEEETGAICATGAASGVSANGNSTGSSTLTHRHAEDDGRKSLPDFVRSSYEQALKLCEREARIGCIVLVSDEHDDVPEFKRVTLTDPRLLQLLFDNDFVVWGGDVRDKDAWMAAQKLETTTYPFVAFVALQPQRGASRSSSTTGNMTVLSRHQGPATPDAGPTSASKLVAHLETQLLPRVKPFLDRVRATLREREHERDLRRMQEEAFEVAARKDRERIERRIEEERRQQREQQEREQKEREEREKKASEELEKARWQEKRGAWRRWARRALVPPEAKKGGIRVTVRMPDGSRRIRILSPEDSLTGLYAFVDSQFLPSSQSPTDDPTDVPQGFEPGDPGIQSQIRAVGGADSWWGFELFFAYPRKELPWAPNTKLRDIPQMNGGAQLVVERRPADAGDDGSDSDS
ncbi:hypothetical protein PUNSTDRAFT_88916 [Punctularia strigosozonata HHB-11173 SS5]|uniref:uncharacterized protein n=1 Tax=Punctularia strigosozonata (strain HHB-11173) TaxID=741275 RepID=UPI0004418296|nr:uncharacterized protein PUNSTDRAFT_88916 [Punctularia strigosozonata HHB-11173 SS5]EIN08112.1 hypothetical protein PUNSTDRAFT_88916 [Punctularia strigosozonata HHB-11173 SS5]